MKFSMTLFCIVSVLFLLRPASLPASDSEPSEALFEKLRSLVGEWRGTLPDGNGVDISYEEINGGAIVERYHSRDPMWWNMSTIYHRDDKRIVMSHYCSWGNHPRMSAVISTDAAERIDFDFIDLARNEPENGYMREFEIEFVDYDQVKHYWTWREDGNDTPLQLTLRRVE